MSPLSFFSSADAPPRATWSPQALLRWPAVVTLVVSMFAALTPAAAAERSADLYGKSRFQTPMAKAPLTRDVSALAAYPPATPQSPEHTAFPSVVAPRITTYPPTKANPLPTPPLPACGVIADCSFEVGGGWFGGDLTSPLLPLGIYGAGVDQGYGFFPSAPTDGVLSLLTGWDGDGPGIIYAGQDVILQPNAARLEFDYRAGWNMAGPLAGTLARTFSVEIQPSGGGSVLSSTTILIANPGTSNLDTGNLTGVVDISAFAGQPVRILFVWSVPENYTGPAVFQLDRIAVREDNCLAIGNCSFEWGTLGTWNLMDFVTPLIPAGVYASGAALTFNPCTPTDGGYAFGHGWDGNASDLLLFQDLVLPAAVSTIEFDYSAYCQNFGSLPRTFGLDIEPWGGGVPLWSQTVLTAPPGSASSAGPATAHLDVSALAGQAVRLVFRWRVPENYTGPGEFQLDHIRLTQGFCASIDNCSFETGAPPAWTTSDMVTPYIPIHVGPAGESAGFGFFTSLPTDGTYALLTGFDGDGPNTILAHQDVTIPLWADLLRFDYRAAWDMLNVVGTSTRPRTCEVAIEPWGGGPTLASDFVLLAPPQTANLDTGPLSRTFPVGAFAGQPVRIVFRWIIPESFTGPGFFQLDRVMFDNSVLAVGPGGSPGQALDLRPAMPNPSRQATTFSFTLPKAGDVEMEIVDVRGARVWSERHAGLAAGEHQLAWSGMRAGGGAAAAGVYYARVRTPAGSSSRMFVRVR